MHIVKRSIALIALLCGATAAGAQVPPSYAELMITAWDPGANPAGSTLLSFDPRTGRLRTMNVSPGLAYEWAGMSENNGDLLVTGIRPGLPPSGFIGRADLSGGGLRNLRPITAPSNEAADPSDAMWDDQGRLLVGSGRRVLRFNPNSSSLTTIATFGGTPPPRIRGIAFGPGNNGFNGVNAYILNANPIFGSPQIAPPFLFGVDPISGGISTLVESRFLDDAVDVFYDRGRRGTNPRGFIALLSNAALRQVVRVNFRTGAVQRLQATFPFQPHAMVRTPVNSVWIAGRRQNPAQHEAVEVDLSTGAVIRTVRIPLPPTSTITNLEVYGTNNIDLQGQADAPLIIDINGNDTALAGANYQLALALDTSPPAATLTIPAIGAVDVNLAFDALLFLSINAPASIGLSGSSGILDANGNASATLSIPPSTPPTMGLNIYAAWVAWKGSTILRVSESELFVLP